MIGAAVKIITADVITVAADVMIFFFVFVSPFLSLFFSFFSSPGEVVCSFLELIITVQ